MSDEKVKFSGRDLAEAIAAARRHFNVSRQEIGYERIQGGKIGLLSDSGPMVEILAWTQEAPPAPAGGYDRARPGRGRPERRGPGDRGGRGHGHGHEGGRSFGHEGGRGGFRDRPPRREEEEEIVSAPPLLPAAEVTDPKAVVEHLTLALLRGLDFSLDLAGVDEAEGGLRVRMEGEDTPLLLEAEAEGLEAFQYLANRILMKDRRVTARVTYDVGGRRASQEAKLAAEAQRVAEEVLASGEIQKMRPLGPYERRLVHMTLSGIPGVKTFSTGVGRVRRLHVAPVDAPIPADSSSDQDPGDEN